MKIYSIFLITAFLFISFESVLAGPVKYFQTPNAKDIPNDEFGRIVHEGRNIFTDTQTYAKPFVGNSLNCVNCHLNDGRLANSSPLWAAYVLYPSYRQKTKQVDTLANRIQGCFMYSMNGKAPAADSDIMKNLVTYMYWMSKGAPTGIILPGRGYPELKKPKREPSWDAGLKVYEKNCILCHGVDGAGQFIDGKTIFPPLWGEKSFNWGAGMHRINTAAGFIKATCHLPVVECSPIKTLGMSLILLTPTNVLRIPEIKVIRKMGSRKREKPYTMKIAHMEN